MGLLLRIFIAIVFFLSFGGNVLAGEPMTLAECLTVAMQNSAGVAVADSVYEAQQAELRSARKSLYPALSYQYVYADQTDSSLVDSTYSSTVSLDQPLYRGGGLVAGVAVKKLELAAADLGRRKSRGDLVLRVHQYYYGLLSSERLQAEATQAFARLQAHRHDAQSFFDSGLIPRNDLLESEVREAQGEQDLLAASNQLSLARSRLNLLLRRPADMPLAVVDCLISEARPVQWEDVLQLALKNRVEIAQRELAMDEAEKQIVIARADHLPALDFSATYQKSGGDYLVVSPYAAPAEEKTAQAVARWKFWTWGQGSDKVAAARQRFRQSKERKVEIVDAVTLEVRKAYLDLLEADKNIAVTEKAIRAAEENYRINEARYQSRLNTSTEVLDAQSLLTKARTNYFVALHKYNLALVTLDWVTGTLQTPGKDAS
ncbi:MAG: TolC family protein [Desulfobulbaceae bacterium]|nr:TolC family protein [Desulfobulbaceae bacterium]